MSASTPFSVPLGFIVALLFLAVPARAQISDRALLSTFCDAANIRGSTCKRAKGYPNAGGRRCDVKLTENRYSGKFGASGNPLLVVAYESGCEAHATDDGGSAVFEQVGGTFSFRGFQPGAQANDCVTVAQDEQHDALICLAGHMGQGILVSAVAQMAFKENNSRHVGISRAFLLTAEDTNGAYGANVVTCKEPPPKYFEVTKLRAGPGRATVMVDAGFADAEIIRTACGRGLPPPQETFGTLAPGEAYVPAGSEKTGTFIIDLLTRKVVPQG